MKQSKLIIIIALLLILENGALWYVSSFYYQYQAQERKVDSKAGQADVCEIVPISSDLVFVLKKMREYYPTIHLDLDSSSRIVLDYGSEWSRGFATGISVGFIFDDNYRLTHKICGSGWEPEVPMF